jgi:transposase|tara:strand:+ start:369 stop:752 length:384 start_codon:yes stop_codon:yes gene_type:complete
MKSQQDQHKALVEAFLPKDLFQYFEITNVSISEEQIQVDLDELNNPPSSHAKIKLVSKGFHAPVIIQDFPIRERAVFLHVRRRKWKEERTGKIVSNSWDTAAKGTRFTKGFASFLKEVLGQLPHQQQ